MKKLLLITLLFPLIATAQDAANDFRTYPEFRLGVGAAIAQGFVCTQANVAFLYNFKQIQLGVLIEGGADFNGTTYFSPAATANYAWRLGDSYAYGGIMAGPAFSGGNKGLLATYNPSAKGYAVGAQAGYVWSFARHWALFGEIGARIYNLKREGRIEMIPGVVPGGSGESSYIYYTDTEVVGYIPATVGISFRF